MLPKRLGVAPDALLLAAAGLAPKRPPPPGVDPVCCEVAVDDGKKLLGAVVVVAGVAEAVVVDPAPKMFPVAGAVVALLPEPDVPEVVVTAPREASRCCCWRPRACCRRPKGSSTHQMSFVDW